MNLPVECVRNSGKTWLGSSFVFLRLTEVTWSLGEFNHWLGLSWVSKMVLLTCVTSSRGQLEGRAQLAPSFYHVILGDLGSQISYMLSEGFLRSKQKLQGFLNAKAKTSVVKVVTGQSIFKGRNHKPHFMMSNLQPS